MLSNILNLEGVAVLDRKQQDKINGGELTNCTRNVETINGNEQFVFECWDTVAGRWKRFNILGREIPCNDH